MHCNEEGLWFPVRHLPPTTIFTQHTQTILAPLRVWAWYGSNLDAIQNMRCFRCFTRFINYFFRCIPPQKKLKRSNQISGCLGPKFWPTQPGGQIHSGGSQPLGWRLLLAAAGLDVGHGTGAEIRTWFFSFSCRIPDGHEYSSMFFNRKTQNRWLHLTLGSKPATCRVVHMIHGSKPLSPSDLGEQTTTTNSFWWAHDIYAFDQCWSLSNLGVCYGLLNLGMCA